MEVLKGILAGIMISISCVLYISIPNSVIGAAAFSIGLITIIIFELNLFTGQVGYIVSVYDAIFSFCTLLSNVLGCCLSYLYFAYIKNEDKYFMSKVELLSEKKYCYPILKLFLMGVGCGILMYIAIESFKKSVSIIIVILCVSTFILCGFEHSIADAFYMLFTIESPISYIGKIIIIALGNALGSNIFRIITNKNFMKKGRRKHANANCRI